MKLKNLYVKESNGQVKIGNELVELGFDPDRKGALVSIVDKASGYQFVRDGEAPKTLFRLAVRRQADRELDWLEGTQAQTFRWTKKEHGSSITLAMDVTGFDSKPILVRIQVTLKAGSALSTWHMAVEGLAPDAAVYQLVCPVVSGVLKVGDGVPGEAIAAPRQSEGYVFHDPYPVVDNLPLKSGEGPESPQVGMGALGGTYPGGWPMQFVLYYNDVAGLYLACHDEKQNVKSFNVGPLGDWGMYPVMSIAHCSSEMMGMGVEFGYETVLGVFHGEWWEGADIYKSWARKQWWCEKKLWEKDIAPWLRKGVAVFQMQNYDIPVLRLTHPLDEIADRVNQLSREIGVPLLGLVFNFEGGGGWTGPKGFFPPREGEEAFRRAMEKMRAAGNYGFVYMPGGTWYIAISSYSPPFNSWPEFEKEGRPAAVVGANGKVNIGSMGFAGWEYARICPRTKFAEEMTASLLLGSIERRCPVVQIDNFPCGCAVACHAPAHGHPLGYGSWLSEDWNRILKNVRERARALDADSAITTEGISENFIPYLDLFDQRAGNMEYFGHYEANDPMGGELIPIFSYVYGGYIGAYCAAFPECSRTEVLYWARCFGKSLVQGVVPTGGWYLPDTKELNPVTTAFWKKVARAAAQECWKYIMFGEMLKPPKIDVPKIDFSYVRCLDLVGLVNERHPERRHVVRDYAVQHGSFRSLDGTVGHIFVNISQDVREFDAALPSYDGMAKTCAIDAVRDGQRSTLQRAVKLPVTEHIRMEPLSVLMLEVREVSA
ncbi:MAG: hypothetical protein KJ964_03175 [Verrucomicrobia bacterium]|nr:hypothetical protein [Verrucomicrobiota bacterium]MBU1734641.1 hypothetical protein [Verrucomicrobiota bacterium]MBU1855359.1 hypothetical protein [Verrucomicrobiota bacterium]